MERLRKAWELLEEFKNISSPKEIFNIPGQLNWFRSEKLLKESLKNLIDPLIIRVGINRYSDPWSGLFITGLENDHLLCIEDIEEMQRILISWYNGDFQDLSLKILGRVWISEPVIGNTFKVLEAIPDHRIPGLMSSLEEMSKWFPENSLEYQERIKDLTENFEVFYKLVGHIPGARAIYKGKSNDSRAQRRKERRKARRLSRLASNSSSGSV